MSTSFEVFEMKISKEWKGDDVRVEVLYSVAGVATSVIMEVNDKYFVLDAGDGLLRDMVTRGYDPMDLRAIMISHGHYDHIGALWAIMGFMRMMGREEELYVVTPKNCAEAEVLIEKFKELHRDSMFYNILHMELVPEQTVIIDNCAITAFETLHGGLIAGRVLPRVPSIGYIIDVEGQKVVYTGDSGDCASLRNAVKGADLAIIEATWEEGESNESNYHLCINTAEEIGKTAKNYMIIHRKAK
ncbi:MAG: hypothetical protein DRN20_04025 [Thermoplasmata archaeon]|nr:MAG: hypothetical protein DRN20_04025 [Thermoplasmata archaeon]